jgi:hypothetical protein
MVASDSCMANGPITTEYAGQGVIFSGFGKSGGALINGGCNYRNNSMAGSPPNIMGFASILLYPDGGIEASPETLTFYPPIVSLQFDTFTFADICEGTNLLFVANSSLDCPPFDAQFVTRTPG